MIQKFLPPKDRGFTLIELLVVIAIIGILSSVVLASVNIARVKGSDAAIKADLSNMRAQASIYYDAHNQSYSTDASTCTTAGSMFAVDPTIAGAITHVGSVSLGAVSCFSNDGQVAVGTAASSWAISAPLKSVAQSWCVDSMGNAASGTATLVSNVAICQ